MNEDYPRNQCPVCRYMLPQPLVITGRTMGVLHCPNCGNHSITAEALEAVEAGNFTDIGRAGLAHQVSKLPGGACITSNLVTQWGRNPPLPGPMERIDILVTYLATEFQPAHGILPGHDPLMARLGCANEPEVDWVCRQAGSLNLVTESRRGYCELTITGWQHHQELMRNAAGSRHAFMAMKFGDAELDAVFAEHLRPAVAATGFDLRTVAGDHKTAGSIDNRMRVEIRTSRFVVCDLTHGNRGAYWEAGFAEGLGRPVFYVCRRDVLADRTHADHPHFDTAHQLITPWSWETMAEDMQELKAVIRATLPAEATMEDA